MLISLIAGIGKEREIGLDNKLLWHVKADLQNFKRLTMGHHLVMGRKTFASIGRPLPGRTSLILSSQPDLELPAACLRVGSLQQALRLASERQESELFVIGGAKVFADFLPFAHRLYLSRMDFRGKADTFFPAFEHYPWTETFHQEHPAKNAGELSWSYHILEKSASSWC